MARFFRHLFCNCDTRELADQVSTLHGKVTTLSRQVADAEDYIERMAGRVLKRIERSQPPASKVDDVTAAIAARRSRVVLPGG